MKSDLLVIRATTFGRCVRDNQFDWSSAFLYGDYCSCTCPLKMWGKIPFGSSDPHGKDIRYVNGLVLQHICQRNNTIGQFSILIRQLPGTLILFIWHTREDTMVFLSFFVCLILRAESCRNKQHNDDDEQMAWKI